jgi:antitoxin MazE
MIKTRIVRIGNSQGIRIPKVLLQQVGLLDEVEVEVQANQLVVRPVTGPRQGWDEQFQDMALAQDDRLLDAEPLVLTEWEASEWRW